MARYLLYVALHEEGDSQAEFETVDECVEAAGELIRKTFGSGRQLVTFSIGDITDYGDQELVVVADSEGDDVDG